MPVSFTWTVQRAATGAVNASTVPGQQAGADAARDEALDPITGDIKAGPDGDTVFLRGADAIASDLQSEFLMFLGEWYLDLGEGFPWFQEVLGQTLNETQLRRRVEEHSLLIPGVVSVENYALTKDNQARSISFSFTAVCDDGALIAAVATATQGA